MDWKADSMDWYDVYDVLYDGDKSAIEKLRCPDCGCNIYFRYTGEARAFTVICYGCGHYSKGNGGPMPNCAKLLGDSAVIGAMERDARAL